MEDEFIEVQWETVKTKRKLISIKEWMARHPEATLWRLAWAIWWRIAFMALGTLVITGLFLYGMING